MSARLSSQLARGPQMQVGLWPVGKIGKINCTFETKSDTDVLCLLCRLPSWLHYMHHASPVPGVARFRQVHLNVIDQSTKGCRGSLGALRSYGWYYIGLCFGGFFRRRLGGWLRTEVRQSGDGFERRRHLVDNGIRILTARKGLEQASRTPSASTTLDCVWSRYWK